MLSPSLHQLATISPSNCRRQPPGWTPGPHCPPHAVPHAARLHFVDPLPCPKLSKALAVSKTASITPRHDYNVPGTQVGKRQLNDVLYFPVGTTTQDLPSSRVTKASGPGPGLSDCGAGALPCPHRRPLTSFSALSLAPGLPCLAPCTRLLSLLVLQACPHASGSPALSQHAEPKVNAPVLTRSLPPTRFPRGLRSPGKSSEHRFLIRKKG